MRRMYPLLVAALLALILAGCGAGLSNGGKTSNPGAIPEPSSTSSKWIEPNAPASSETSPLSTEQPSPDNNSAKPSKGPQDQLKDIGQEVVEILRERDLKSLAEWIDPEQGLRFSPYSHIDKKSDLVFKADALPTFKDTTKLQWGSADGSGDPIKLTFRDYYEKFVYNHDFADAPNVSVNKIIGIGNTEFNGTAVYPNAGYVEFHFPSFDKKVTGMDWQSLVLVFVPVEKDWKLVAIVHGQWTI
jgi:hypothetical protein